MIAVRKAAERGRTEWGWLDSRHTFSFGEYYDPRFEGFRTLRVHQRRPRGARRRLRNTRAPGHGDPVLRSRGRARAQGFVGRRRRHPAGRDPVHARRHRRHPQRVQRVDAASPCTSSRSGSSPASAACAPRYDQKPFDQEAARRGFVLLASRDGRNGSIQVEQDLELEVTRLSAGDHRSRPLGDKRHVWVHVARGAVTVNGAALAEGDGASVSEESRLELEAAGDAEVLVFDLA